MKLRVPSLSRFSLRTLFVLVTVLAIGLGYVGHQYQIVRERSEVAGLVFREGWDRLESPRYLSIALNREPGWFYRFLGEGEALGLIRLPDKREDLERIFTAFPEALLYKHYTVHSGRTIERDSIEMNEVLQRHYDDPTAIPFRLKWYGRDGEE